MYLVSDPKARTRPWVCWHRAFSSHCCPCIQDWAFSLVWLPHHLLLLCGGRSHLSILFLGSMFVEGLNNLKILKFYIPVIGRQNTGLKHLILEILLGFCLRTVFFKNWLYIFLVVVSLLCSNDLTKKENTGMSLFFISCLYKSV